MNRETFRFSHFQGKVASLFFILRFFRVDALLTEKRSSAITNRNLSLSLSFARFRGLRAV